MADAGRRWCCGRYAHPRSSSVLGTSRDDFSPEKLATCLKDALFGYTASADFIIYILATHSHKQCQAICRHYHLLTAQHLQTDVNKQLGGYVCDAALMLLQDKWEFIARNIHCEMKKKFADIATFIELLGAQNNYNMQKIKEIFYKMYRCELDDAAEKEVHGHFQKIIALLLKTDRDESFKVDHQKVEEDAKVLRAAGVGIKYASDAAVLFTFLNSRSYSHLKKMFEAYHRLTGKTIQEKIQNEFVTECFQHALVLYGPGIRLRGLSPAYFSLYVLVTYLQRMLKNVSYSNATCYQQQQLKKKKKKKKKQQQETNGMWINHLTLQQEHS
ncbi:annexin A5-like [Schistocerca piceifrons]|uniref:annexin A5-like n=1 Tax=Schistocerca piceifrons TaxID=274613 RepID=UPI001F5E6EA7|nr:annexin A5-like [Schistocerca piceifrons]